VQRIAALIAAWRPDLVQTWSVQMDVAGGLACALTRTPWVLRESSSAPLYARGAKPRLRLAVARLAARLVVANSAAGLAYWAAKAPALPRRRVFNGVPHAAVAATAPAPAGRRPLVLCAGRLEPVKNLDVVLRAVAALLPRLELDLVVCGHGPERARLEALARELGLADCVQFTGFTADLWSYLRTARVFVSTSAFEGCPNTVLECFAAGTPAILSDHPSHREIADETSALFVPVGDVAATAVALRAVLDDPAAAMARAELAHGRVAGSSLPAMADGFEQVYRELLALR
jgi:glycosyltransferase involved in cell wall biosynthesis